MGHYSPSSYERRQSVRHSGRGHHHWINHRQRQWHARTRRCDPANKIASVRTGSLTLVADANFFVDLFGSDRRNLASVAATGTTRQTSLASVSLNGANLQLALNYAPVFGDKLFIVNNDQVDAIVGTFAKLNGTPTTLPKDQPSALFPRSTARATSFGSAIGVSFSVVMRTMLATTSYSSPCPSRERCPARDARLPD
jgi:hypothetical protein